MKVEYRILELIRNLDSKVKENKSGTLEKDELKRLGYNEEAINSLLEEYNSNGIELKTDLILE
nr:MAG TPA: hypothetical protein [Caudoviricetes sp.]